MNNLISIFETSSNQIHACISEGKYLLRNVLASWTINGETVLVSDARLNRSVRQTDSVDACLTGKCIVVECKDQAKNIDVIWRITTLDKFAGVVFELTLINNSPDDLILDSCEPLRLNQNEYSGCCFASYDEGSLVRKALTHGRMYHDPGELYDFSADGPGSLNSYWNIAFFAPQTKECLVAGYLDSEYAEGEIRTGWVPKSSEYHDRDMFNLTAFSNFAGSVKIKSGKHVSSGRVCLLYNTNSFQCLESYAALSGTANQVSLNPIINGWCSWFVKYNDVNENDILSHAEFVAKNLSTYSMNWIQIDDGFQCNFGDWEGNDKFPHGLKWLAQQIKNLGLKAGIWVAPYAISSDSMVARNHPDWLVKDQNGNTQEIVPEHFGQAQYILDITHPEAQSWFCDLFSKMTNDCGYDFVKIDFVEWTILAAKSFYDSTMTTASAYRLGCKLIRKSIGKDRHFLDCGPGPLGQSCIDSMRIQLDRPTPPCTVWEHYSGWYNSVIPAVAKRYYFHAHTWINDPDHLRIRDLSIHQAQCAASIIGMSGGTVISGDNLPELDNEKLNILKKILPAYGASARPINLFEKLQADIFILKVCLNGISWHVLSCFNTGADATTKEMDFAKLEVAGFNSKLPYLVFEFWSQTFIGVEKEKLSLDFPPTSVKLLILHEFLNRPQVVATDRHVTSGAVELAEIIWDEDTKCLSGMALGAPGMDWNLFVYVPNSYQCLDFDISMPVDITEYQNGQLLKIKLVFKDYEEKKDWYLKFVQLK